MWLTFRQLGGRNGAGPKPPPRAATPAEPAETAWAVRYVAPSRLQSAGAKMMRSQISQQRYSDDRNSAKARLGV